MNPIYLVTKSNFLAYVSIAQNLPDKDLNPRILEAQNFDLRPLLGDTFWFDFLSNQTTLTDAYTAILNGSDYQAMPFLPQQQGIRPILVYSTCARLIRSLDIHITPTGVMQKRNEFSDHVDIKAINLKATEYQNIALGYWEDLKKYINIKGKLVYPLFSGFNTCENNNDNGSTQPRIQGIGGKSLSNYNY